MPKFFLKNKKINTGFTLVEMMVAIAVFSTVMVVAMSALLIVIDANTKARSLKAAVNNVSFALDSISRDMRMGTEYSCSTGTALPFSDLTNCPTGGAAGTEGKMIKYRSQEHT